MTDLLVGIAIGLGTGLVSWWIVTRAISPKIAISKQIVRRETDDGPRYRIKIVNRRRWPLPRTALVDVSTSVELRLRGHQPQRPTTIQWIPVPIGRSERLAVLEKDHITALRIREIDPGSTEGWPEAVTKSLAAGELTFEEILEIATDLAEVRVVVAASHKYTNARRSFISRYGRDDIVRGVFQRRGAGVIAIDAPLELPDDSRTSD